MSHLPNIAVRARNVRVSVSRTIMHISPYVYAECDRSNLLAGTMQYNILKPVNMHITMFQNCIDPIATTVRIVRFSAPTGSLT